MKIADIMTTSVVALPQNGTLGEVMQKFIHHRLDMLPIIDAAQRVVGLITIRNLVELFLPRYYDLLRDFSVLEDKGQLGSLFGAAFVGLDHMNEKLILAADVMESDIRWVSSEDTLLQAASRLNAQSVGRLPVIDRDQKLVGVISDFEVVLALLRGNAAVKS